MTIQNICARVDDLTRELSFAAEQLEKELVAMREGPVSAADAARAYYSVKTSYEDLDKKRKSVYRSKDFLEKAIVPEKMEKDGTDMVRIPDLARSFSLQQRMSATMVDKDVAFEWLRANGNGDLIQPTVNASSLTALCRNLMTEEGIDPPEDAVKISTYHAIGVNKYTPKS